MRRLLALSTALASLLLVGGCRSGQHQPVVTIAPAAPKVAVGGCIDFGVVADGQPLPADVPVTWTVPQGHGSITAQGCYTAPLVAGEYSVIATSPKYPGRALAATVVVFAPAAGAEVVSPIDGATMVFVPAGEFLMGSDSAIACLDERPVRKVFLDAYYIDKTEVTVAAYHRFCDATRRAMPAAPAWGWIDTCPMVNVSWEDAAAYAEWTGKALPTEAQWEKAARGTDGRQYPWGNDWDPDKCVNSRNNAKGPASVGAKPEDRSPYGCLDMAGSVWEWCADWRADYDAAQVSNPTGPVKGTDRVVRGGSWHDSDSRLFRTSSRSSVSSWFRVPCYGFRCVSR